MPANRSHPGGSACPDNGAGRILADAARAAGTALGLDTHELARALQVGDPAAAGCLDPESAPAMRARDVIRVYLSLQALVGDNPPVIRHWMRGYNRGTRGVPAEQIQSAEGLAAILGYLSRF